MMRIIFSNALYLHNAPRSLLEDLYRRLTFPNPKWIENEKYGRWQGNTPEFLECATYQEESGVLVIPRGYVQQLTKLCESRGISYTIDDRRRILPEVDFESTVKLRPFQLKATREFIHHDFGVLSAPTGSGKTVMALVLIDWFRQPVLVVVHSKELLNQWLDRIETFLGVPRDEIGIIGDGRRRIGDRITVALVQSLYKCAEDVAPHIGYLIVDECHRAPCRTFTEAVTAFDCKYMLGLSATPWRRDRLSRLIYWYLGDLVYEIKKPGLVETGDALPAEVVWRRTEFEPTVDPSAEYTKMLRELTADPGRNALIVSDVVREVRRGRGTILMLSDRKAHCEALQAMLAGKGIMALLLTGDLSNGERQRVVEAVNAGRVRVLVATGQLIGEGFDCSELSTLFLATPIKFDGRLLQYLGRVLRSAPGKVKARIYDYVDSEVGVLKAAAKTRARVYSGHAVKQEAA
jgi:superfamily II DNA or RNA helicase